MQAGPVLPVEGSEPAGAAEARGSGSPTRLHLLPSPTFASLVPTGATVILPLQTLLGVFPSFAVGDVENVLWLTR